QGRGIQVVREAGELASVDTSSAFFYAQRYYPPDGFDRKIYCIGGQFFGVLRSWPVRSYEDKLGQAFTLSPELREVSARCGRAFGGWSSICGALARIACAWSGPAGATERSSTASTLYGAEIPIPRPRPSPRRA